MILMTSSSLQRLFLGHYAQGPVAAYALKQCHNCNAQRQLQLLALGLFNDQWRINASTPSEPKKTIHPLLWTLASTWTFEKIEIEITPPTALVAFPRAVNHSERSEKASFSRAVNHLTHLEYLFPVNHLNLLDKRKDSSFTGAESRTSAIFHAKSWMGTYLTLKWWVSRACYWYWSYNQLPWCCPSPLEDWHAHLTDWQLNENDLETDGSYMHFLPQRFCIELIRFISGFTHRRASMAIKWRKFVNRRRKADNRDRCVVKRFDNTHLMLLWKIPYGFLPLCPLCTHITIKSRRLSSNHIAIFDVAYWRENEIAFCDLQSADPSASRKAYAHKAWAWWVVCLIPGETKDSEKSSLKTRGMPSLSTKTLLIQAAREYDGDRTDESHTTHHHQIGFEYRD